MKYCLTLLLYTLLFTANVFGQNRKRAVAELDSLFEKDDYKSARKIAENRIATLMKEGDPDTIAAYLPYLATAIGETGNVPQAKTALSTQLKKIQQTFPYHPGLVSVYFAVADFFSNEGDHQSAYLLLGDLSRYFNGKEKDIEVSLHKIESNRGSYAMRMGNYGLASAHYRASLVFTQKLKDPDLSEVFIANNSMGIVMWYSSKLDSCLHFFETAVSTLQKMEASPLNHNFRVAMIQNNIGNVYDELGRKEEAIVNFEKAIQNYKLYLASPGNDPRKKNALTGQFQSVDNLAKTYQELGDYSKAHNLLYYSYEEKLRNFGEQSPEVYKSLIQLGVQYYFQKDYTQAKNYLTRGLTLLQQGNIDKTIWIGETFAYLGSIAAAQGNVATAKNYYNRADSAYKTILGDGYSAEYMQYLVNVSAFYANNGEVIEAVRVAKHALDYAVANQGRASLLAFHHLLNQANIFLKVRNFTDAIQYSNEAQHVLYTLISKTESLMDSLSLDMERPSVILVNARARYALLDSVDEQSLRRILSEVKEATAILDRRKVVLSEAKDAAFLMANHKDLIDFTKELELKLYELTGNHAYLNQLIFLQESAIYNRIRSRFDRQKAMQFARVPEAILARETSLREALNRALQEKRIGSDNLNAYLEAQKNWNSFQAQLRKEYPDYFNMRYADKMESEVTSLEQTLQPGMTIVRYIFIDKKLFALVMSKGKRNWVALPVRNLVPLVVSLADSADQQLLSAGTPFELYRQLWQPLEKFVSTDRVTIIPDDILYYVSFEMLTSGKPVTMQDWVSQSLLNRYAISYHYSLMALAPAARKSNGKGFAAFAPGFSDNEKDSYRAAKKDDTLNIDNEYLNLIPLPFSINLSQKMQRDLGGDIFIGSNATHAAFRSNAGKHSVIQLGTHAVANNQYPQFSRLIFAKDLANINQGNSLYLNEIYDCDMSADLTVLTACETGRPGFFDGEGMISMAHAFHYAGSESMLTGLWKIDEQAATVITEYFYRNLEDGLSKDIALQKAKLTYLGTTGGRMISPKYWAGLVIMGDVSPIRLHRKRNNGLYWIAGAIVVFTIAGIYWRRRNTNLRSSTVDL